jgi:hypothetical protein
MRAGRGTRVAAAGLGLAGVLLGAVACQSPVTQPIATVVAGNQLCGNAIYMPPSTGIQTPTGFSLQMTGVTLASANTSKTLAMAYRQFNGMTCTKYDHTYTETPPRFYYYDCVGFTGYTVRKATPTAWTSLVKTIGLKPGFVPTPDAFQTFMNGLRTTGQPGWQSVASVGAIRAGDILAWQPALADGSPDTAKGAVGHSVMPLVTPRAIPGSNGTRWEVVVMDSTAGGHGPQDTRRPGNKLSTRNAPLTRGNGQVEASGLGIGTIVLDSDTSGHVNGIEWVVGAKPEKIVFGAARALA